MLRWETDLCNFLNSYAALGLMSNPNSLMEPVATPVVEDEEPVAGPSTPRAASALPSAKTQRDPVPKGKGRLIRDPTGKVIGVEIPEDDAMELELEEGDEEGDGEGGLTRGHAAKPMREDREPAPVVPKTAIVAGMYLR